MQRQKEPPTQKTQNKRQDKRNSQKVVDSAEHIQSNLHKNERIKEATTTFFFPRLIKSRRRKLHAWSYNNR